MDWLKKNGWAIIIVAASTVGNYAVLGYRVDNVESVVMANTIKIETVRQSQEDSNLSIQVALAKIQTDLEYLKARVR